jgi:hypothetical protein
MVKRIPVLFISFHFVCVLWGNLQLEKSPAGNEVRIMATVLRVLDPSSRALSAYVRDEEGQTITGISVIEFPLAI